MHGDNVVSLAHSSRPDTPELLHVTSDAEEESQVHAEGTDVGSSLARDPEDTKVTLVVELDKLGLVDGTDTKLTLDGRDEGRALEEGSGEGLEGASEGLLGLESSVKADNANVLLSCEPRWKWSATESRRRIQSQLAHRLPAGT